MRFCLSLLSFRLLAQDKYNTIEYKISVMCVYPCRCISDPLRVTVLESGTSLEAHFSALLFLYHSNYTNTFVHCSLSLCDKTASTCSTVSPEFTCMACYLFPVINSDGSSILACMQTCLMLLIFNKGYFDILMSKTKILEVEINLHGFSILSMFVVLNTDIYCKIKVAFD